MKRHRTYLKPVLKITIIYFAINFVVSLFSIDAAANMSTAYTVVIFFYVCYLLWVLIDFVFDKINQRLHPSVKDSEAQKTKSVHTIEQKKSAAAISNDAPKRKTVTRSPNNDHAHSKPLYEETTHTAKIASLPRNFNANSSSLIIHHLRRRLYDFVVVDIETTGLSSDAKVIQLSAIRYERDQSVASFNKYINPGNLSLSAKITAITGITSEQLRDAPSFDDVKESFTAFVGKLPWVGHNINRFDIPHLVRNGLPMQEFSTLDTLKLARKKLNLDHYGLEYLKHYYNIRNGSHNAFEDCKTNAIVYQHLRDDDLSPIQSNEPESPESLSGLTFAISGTFAGHSRSDIEELITSHGGIVRTSVSHKTDYLVDGTQISESLTDGIHSSKELKAKEYGTKILDLDKLNQLISTKE